MEDDWDLHAVVRGCTTTTTTTSVATPTTDTFTANSNQNSSFPSFSTGVQEPKHIVEDLHELYKPFFFSTSQNHPFVSPPKQISSFPINQNQVTNPQKQENRLFFKSTKIQNTQSANRSKRRKNQIMKRVCQVPAEGLSSDIWAWRKYGQKPIKGSPHPRGYYKCSSSKGCLARKQVERSRSDPDIFIITYTAEHNHPAPTHRHSPAVVSRQKETIAVVDSTSEPITAASPVTSPEENVTVEPSSENIESRQEEDGSKMVDHEEDVDFSAFANPDVGDDFFEGLEGLGGTDDGLCSVNFPANVGLSWFTNSSTAAAASSGV